MNIKPVLFFFFYVQEQEDCFMCYDTRAKCAYVTNTKRDAIFIIKVGGSGKQRQDLK